MPGTINAVWGLPYGIVAYGVTGVAATLFIIARNQINEFNRSTRVPYKNPRWRFYSIFGAVTVILAVKALGYAFYAGSGFYEKLIAGDLGAKIVFSIGFFTFPTIWLELVFSRSKVELGFTRYYEDNIKSMAMGKYIMDKYENLVKKSESDDGGIKIIFSRIVQPIAFATVWLSTYIISSVLCFHLWRNHKSMAIPDQNKALQLGQDLLLFVSLISLGLFIANPWGINQGIWFLYAQMFFVGLAVVLGGLAYFPERMNDNQDVDGKPLLFLALYGVTYWFDAIFVGKTGHEAVDGLVGGITPLLLYVLVYYLVVIFLKDLGIARRVTAEFIRKEISKNFANLALHHFGNHLNPPLNTLQVIEEEMTDREKRELLFYDENRIQQVIKLIKNAIKSIEKAADTVNNMKSDVRQASGNANWHSIKNLLEPYHGQVSPVKGGGKITIKVSEVVPGLYIKVNEDSFYNVIGNLVDNAVSAIKQKKPTEPRLGINVGYDKSNATPLSISVIDNGSGIPLKNQERVFESYYSTKGSGLGMGLFIVREFAESCGGKVELDSTVEADAVESGTTFKLMFPKDRVKFGKESGNN